MVVLLWWARLCILLLYYWLHFSLSYRLLSSNNTPFGYIVTVCLQRIFPNSNDLPCWVNNLTWSCIWWGFPNPNLCKAGRQKPCYQAVLLTFFPARSLNSVLDCERLFRKGAPHCTLKAFVLHTVQRLFQMELENMCSQLPSCSSIDSSTSTNLFPLQI